MKNLLVATTLVVNIYFHGTVKLRHLFYLLTSRCFVHILFLHSETLAQILEITRNTDMLFHERMARINIWTGRNMNVNLTPVEKIAAEDSPFRALYPPTEKIPTIVVENFPALGKLAAMRFIEWAQDNPGGVISLPTGKTPEHFIKWIQRLLHGWHKPEIQRLLKQAGVNPSKKPEMEGLHFVQIDEFYPMDSSQHNSFNYYVRHFYIKGFGLDPNKALLIDPLAIGLKPGQKLQEIWPDRACRFRFWRIDDYKPFL